MRETERGTGQERLWPCGFILGSPTLSAAFLRKPLVRETARCARRWFPVVMRNNRIHHAGVVSPEEQRRRASRNRYQR
eukprot:102164-Chlamydomonas_euryale.AAC.1